MRGHSPGTDAVDPDPNEQYRIVRDRYACSASEDGRCRDKNETVAEELGYDAEDIVAVVNGADLGPGLWESEGDCRPLGWRDGP